LLVNISEQACRGLLMLRHLVGDRFCLRVVHVAAGAVARQRCMHERYLVIEIEPIEIHAALLLL